MVRLLYLRRVSYELKKKLNFKKYEMIIHVF